MRFATTVVLASSFAIFLAGCGEEDAPSQSATPSPNGQAGSLADQAGDAWQATRNAFVAETESRVEALEARVAELQAEAAREEASEEVRTLAEDAKSALDSVKADLDRLASAGASEWESLRNSLATALNDLEAKVRPAG